VSIVYMLTVESLVNGMSVVGIFTTLLFSVIIVLLPKWLGPLVLNDSLITPSQAVLSLLLLCLLQ